MKIKSLELAGFKSFYDRTKINFHDNISAVVGPNGCGKSNILDAVKWVLGEQNSRNLRAEGMDNVIATGSEKLKPLGMAEVALTLEEVPDSGFEQVVIKRRLYRSGESEYSINGVKCRLKDITEMFLDTGVGARAYSIVGQGSVESFITAKPEEKRKLIEEVAGIVKYKTRRKETLSRIESTKENLNRVLDMKNEVSKQMETLSQQAEQAKQYKELTKELKILEHQILNTKLEKLSNKKTSLLQQKKSIETRISDLNLKKDEKITLLNDIEGKNSGIEIEVEQREKEIYELKSELQEKNSYQNFAVKESDAIDQYTNRLKKEIEILRNEIEILEKNKIEKTKELERIRIGKASCTDTLSEKENILATLKEKSANSKNSLDQAGKTIFDTLNQQSSLGSTKSAFAKELEELELRKETVVSQLEKLISDKNINEKELSFFRSEESKIKNRFEEKKEEKQKIDSELYDLRIDHEKKTGELNKIETRINECSSKIEIISKVQANYEWLPEVTRDFVLQQKGNGVLGVISDFIIAPKNYERAVEAAFGEKLNWIVVKENKEAIYAIESLRESSVGRGTFLPVKESVAKNGHNRNGYDITSVKDLISISGIDKKLIESILSEVYVADNLNHALNTKAEMGNGACFATLQGDYVDSSGAITGGFSSGGVFERKREIEELSEEVKELKESLELKRNSAKKIKEKIIENESKSTELGEVLKQYEIKSVENIKDQSNLVNKIENIQRQLDSLDSENNNIDNKLGNKNQRLTEIDDLLSSLEIKKKQLDEEFKKYEREMLDINGEEKELEEEITRLKIENASIFEKEHSLENEIIEIDKRISITNEKILIESKEIEIKNEEKSNLLVTKEKAALDLNNLNSSLLEKEKLLSNIKEKRLNLKNTVDENRRLISEINEKLSLESSNLSSLEIKLNSTNIEIQHLREQKHNTRQGNAENLTQNDASQEGEFNLAEAEIKFKKIKRQIDNFGLVNLLAPEEYKKLEERNDFLAEQTEDLEKAMNSLLEAIKKLDRESVAKFKEAFEIIDNKFREIFSRLFDGGEGKLLITDPEDILQTGIEVMVKPRGKKFQSISLLSGGEKALSAIALIISACFVKPVPFLLFDEIDAPLDELNTVRFSKLMKEISAESQVIIITHNKRTMQEVDSLIGITSDRSITSKVVSVELN